MLTPVHNKCRSLLGATDLTLLAPIKRGLIPALDSRSYQSRVTMLLRTLNALGVSRREARPTPLIAEVVDEIKSIRAFRVAVVQRDQAHPMGPPLPHLLLSVSFDGGWEPYMRRIWRDLGPLLDVIFCNCEGYLLSQKHGYAAYAGWVRSAQVSTEFYYDASALTVADMQELRKSEGKRLGSAASATGTATPTPTPTPTPAAGTELLDQARAALVGLYRLTDMYPPLPGNEDGLILRRAARLLLRSVVKENPIPPERFWHTPTEEDAWDWFMKPLTPVLQVPPPATPTPMQARDLASVQAGILKPYAHLARGCLVLVGLDNAAALAALIVHMQSDIVSAADQQKWASRTLFKNLAFTMPGLELAQVDAGTLSQLPHEFREGMAARASILGDTGYNHPTNWTLPEHRLAALGGPQRVELSTVHAVVQFTLTNTLSTRQPQRGNTDALQTAVDQLINFGSGINVLAVQPMQPMHRPAENGNSSSSGHFEFADGLSQPSLKGSDTKAGSAVAGDLLLGYENSLTDPALQGRLWKDSTFLVVRKLKQDVQAWLDVLPTNPVEVDKVKACLMGRFPNGRNLMDWTNSNDFDYEDDAKGEKCPLFSHVRRANPRGKRDDLMSLPRIIRRGMSYGPRFDPASPDSAERGIVFMAYSASIAEQFEVIQGWLSGGNSSGEGSFSGHRDPIVGIARADDPRKYTFTLPGIDKDTPGPIGSVSLPADRPLVTLQWGLYLFVPSIPALAELRQWASDAAKEAETHFPDKSPRAADAQALQRIRDRQQREEALQAAKGSIIITRLRQLEEALGVDAAMAQWKLALEDMGSRMEGVSQAVWTAVRKAHGGALRTPYGVLVCSKTLVMEVFDNRNSRYTVSGYAARMAKSFGPIYLGLDDGLAYQAQARAPNEAIMAVTTDQAFGLACAATKNALREFGRQGVVVDLEVKDLVNKVLAQLSFYWFGLPDRTFVQEGGWQWLHNNVATCPGHFHSPSRYLFQPNPGDEATNIGERHGQVLKAQVLNFVRAQRNITAAQGTLGQALFAAIANDEMLASTLIGVMMGFLPTVDGNLRGTLYEWVQDRSLWDLQAAYRASKGKPNLERAEDTLWLPLQRTMQLRPVPEVVWRTALTRHTLGGVDVNPGDTVVLSIVSATQEDRLAGRLDPYVVFGGRRKDATGAVPTHACPGHDMAKGVMLGVLAGLLDSASLQPAPSPMSLRLDKLP